MHFNDYDDNMIKNPSELPILKHMLEKTREIFPTRVQFGALPADSLARCRNHKKIPSFRSHTHICHTRIFFINFFPFSLSYTYTDIQVVVLKTTRRHNASQNAGAFNHPPGLLKLCNNFNEKKLDQIQPIRESISAGGTSPSCFPKVATNLLR